MDQWVGSQRVFAVKAFYKNGDNVTAAQLMVITSSSIHGYRFSTKKGTTGSSTNSRKYSSSSDVGCKEPNTINIKEF
ncbi:hypothetical protein Trydic_g8567 [Trypoxylus dichotomus]